MNLLRAISDKPFSFGAIFFVWLPVLGGLGALVFLGLQYWYITLGAFVFVCMIAGIFADRETSENEKQSEEIELHCDNLRHQRLGLLGRLGKPAANGDWAPWQKEIWKEIESLEQQEADFLNGTKVVNLEPLGHNIGRVYKQKPKTTAEDHESVQRMIGYGCLGAIAVIGFLFVFLMIH